jgi:predicted nucleic acid-binding protein
MPKRAVESPRGGSAVLAAATLRGRGLTIPWSDVLVATLALTAGIRVYAHDRHFNLMAPVLGLDLYEPGYGGRYVC